MVGVLRLVQRRTCIVEEALELEAQCQMTLRTSGPVSAKGRASLFRKLGERFGDRLGHCILLPHIAPCKGNQRKLRPRRTSNPQCDSASFCLRELLLAIFVVLRKLDTLAVKPSLPRRMFRSCSGLCDRIRPRRSPPPGAPAPGAGAPLSSRETSGASEEGDAATARGLEGLADRHLSRQDLLAQAPLL